MGGGGVRVRDQTPPSIAITPMMIIMQKKKKSYTMQTPKGALEFWSIHPDTDWNGPTAGPWETTGRRVTMNRSVFPAGSLVNYTNLQPPMHQVTTGPVQHVSAERFDRERRTAEEDDVLFYNSNLQLQLFAESKMRAEGNFKVNPCCV